MAIPNFDTTIQAFRAWSKRGTDLDEIRAAIALQQGGSGGGGGGGGDASAANQVLEIDELEKLVAKQTGSSYTRAQYTLTMAAANSEYSTATPLVWSPSAPVLANVKAIRFGIRQGATQLRWSFTAGKVANSLEPYALRPAGFYDVLENGIPNILYFAAPVANTVLELDVLTEVA